MVEGDQLVALVGKGRARLLVVAVDLFGAVEDLVGRNDLVARVVGEGGQRHVEVVRVLRLHVLADDLLGLVSRVHSYSSGSRSLKPRAAAAPRMSPASAAAADARLPSARSGISSKR